jgi:UDP-N-acetylglucosamine transferase subunit ALG13
MIAQMDAFQEKMDNRQEEIKAQVGSVPSWINVSQEEMKAMLDACLEKMEAKKLQINLLEH